MTIWSVDFEGYEPEREGLREALCTVGNGRFATRGALPEADADGVHYPGTYIAGCFNRVTSTIGDRSIETESMVNAPNWLPLSVRFGDGPWLTMEGVEVLDHRHTLDMRTGVLTRRTRFRDEAGRETGLAQRRFVHMRHPHLAGLETTIVAENWSGPITIRSALDGLVENANVERYRSFEHRHLDPVRTGLACDDTIELLVTTRQSGIEIAEAARTRLRCEGREVDAERKLVERPGYVAQEIAAELEQGRPLTVEKIVALSTSRDDAISEPALAARQHAQRAPSFEELLREHQVSWHHLWRRFHIEIDDDDEPGRILNLHVFHLLQTVSEHCADLDVGVPARGLHGEGYRGHIFWDDLLIFPFLSLRVPQLTRALLLYRYRRLPAARAAAEDAGHQGAMFPWQSGSDGTEATPRLLSPSPTTSGSTTRSPPTSTSWPRSGRSCCSRSRASSPRSRATTPSSIATRSAAASAPTSTTTPTRRPVSRGSTTTPTPT
jgi:alpha,alpha-trehalase